MTTLSGAAAQQLAHKRFRAVVLDEASQATEAATLVLVHPQSAIVLARQSLTSC